MPSDQALIRSTACAIVDQLNSGEVTPLDLLDALENRIAEIDGKTNALPTLCFDRARTQAKALMQKPVGERGLLGGLPAPSACRPRSRTSPTSPASGPHRARRSTKTPSPRIPTSSSNCSKATAAL